MATTQALNNTKQLVGRAKLAQLTGVRPSTLKYYSEIGLLPYHQAEGGLARRYDVREVYERIGEIRGLRALGLSIEQIKARLLSC